MYVPGLLPNNWSFNEVTSKYSALLQLTKGELWKGKDSV